MLSSDWTIRSQGSPAYAPGFRMPAPGPSGAARPPRDYGWTYTANAGDIE